MGKINLLKITNRWLTLMFDTIIITILIILLFTTLILLYKYRKAKHRVVQDLRAAVLNIEELDNHAREIAEGHKVSAKLKPSYRLLPRMEDNYRFIIKTYKELNSDVKDRKDVIPAAEWLFDNFYVIEEQVKEIRLNFPRGYYGALPSLTSGSLKGFPRIYNIALEIVSHTGGKADERIITSFIKSYQTKLSLASGELWAIPIMLRMALIENIRYICGEVLFSRTEREKAGHIADMILKGRESAGDGTTVNMESYIGDMGTLSPAFSEHLIERLRKSEADLGPVFHIMDEKLASQDTSSEDIIQLEHRFQARQQVFMGNSITSLRLISTLDWKSLFEELSHVEYVLGQDPSGVYPSMDFLSRDYYRHEVECMARSLGISEAQVARKAVECAKDIKNDGDTKRKHVGYYIVGDGRVILEKVIGYRPDAGRSIRRFMKRHPFGTYLLPVVLITFLICIFLYNYTFNISAAAKIPLAILTLLIVILPVSDISVGVVNWAVTHTLRPSFLPKLELKDGISDNSASMVVIPTLLSSPSRVRNLFEQLEVYYLSNQEVNLYFGILGDFPDSKKEHMPGDEEIIKTALNEARRLNRKYVRDDKDVFYFFHRYRKYNPCQGVWMGWERKRGKLVEFNRMLRGSQETTYYIKSRECENLPKIKYVITLDADTELPRGNAKKLIGTISHPLNKAVIDGKTGKVAEGFGILQPRVSIGVTNSNKSRFSRIFAGQGGIDPYTTAVSDVYMDLFNEGIYTGKGIYDVDIFCEKLEDTFPENRILSHDLIEGSYARAGLVTDIELVDGFPWKYSSFMARLHRWVRGDWQLFPYLFPVVRNGRGTYVKNTLSGINRWKIFDNMRRSLVPLSLMLLILLGFSILPGSSLLWIGLSIITIAFPIFFDMADAVFLKSKSEGRTYSVFSGFENVIYQILLMVVFLPYKAYMMMDAVLRTIWRLLVSKKRLLEWETAADAENRLRNDINGYFKSMWICFISSSVLIILTVYFSPSSILGAAAFSVIWASSPFAAYWVSMAFPEKYSALDGESIRELRRISRKTWRFFEDFAGSDDNYLPPDNYQEEPFKGAAHRTSSTNIGLLLASILCARDMGYLSTTEMIEKLERVFNSLDKMDRWKGHFYNWYDTTTLQPLRPLYISTVDSGNLVGYLMTLREGIIEYVEKPLINKELAQGLIDTIDLMNEDTEQGIDVKVLNDFVSDNSIDPVNWMNILETLKKSVDTIDTPKSPWVDKVCNMLSVFIKETMDLSGWVDMIYSLPPELMVKNSSNDSMTKRFGRLITAFKSNPPLNDLAGIYNEGLAEINSMMTCSSEDTAAWLKEFKQRIMRSYLLVNQLMSRCKAIVEKVDEYIGNTQFKPLFDEKRQLFSIGYSAEDEQLNRSYYDLLASEARQTSFIAIAKGDVDQSHWFNLGRPLVSMGRSKGLVSWSGTMFEYLMPLLTMKSYKGTLLDETYEFVMKCQAEYGNIRRVPWGVSESGYNAFDIALNYQYRAFGVPRLGLKRGLVNDMVVAPYASLLGLQVDPVSSMKNLNVLKADGLEGPYGFYEAVDYTPSRLPIDKRSVIVKSYMAHHHGMSLLSLDNILFMGIMRERFHRNVIVKSAELLLQEKILDRMILTKDIEDEISPLERIEHVEQIKPRLIKLPVLKLPETQIISNGNYMVVLSNCGSGYSRYNNISVTRWRGDTSFSPSGMFFYIRNVNSNMVWSAAYEPSRVMPEEYSAIFSPDKVEYQRVDGNIDTHTEIAVSPEDNVEVRRISITNHSDHIRTLEVTSYFEVVISPQESDLAHPAFNKLFVMTEFLPEADTLLAKRHPRTDSEAPVWLMHAVYVEGDTVGSTQYETDRMKFIGRNRELSTPAAMDVDMPLSGTTGAVLDPVMSLRKRVRIEPGRTVRITYAAGVAGSRKDVLSLSRKYNDESAVNRTFEMAWTRSQVEQRYLNLKEEDIAIFQELTKHIIYLSPQRRAWEEIIKKNVKGQSGLWAYGISGDIPIMLVSIKRSEEVDIVHQALKIHEYWRMKGFAVDLVILNEYEGSYIQSLQDLLSDIISCGHACSVRDRPCGVFLRQSSIMPEEDVNLLYASARIVIRGDGGPILKQVKLQDQDTALPEYKNFSNVPFVYSEVKDTLERLQYFNDIGGFKPDGSEYIIYIKEGRHTPAPWSNIISNEKIGFLVTESGGGYTWAENSRENKLTPWSNDPVMDTPGEVIYMRDEDDGGLWTVTPSPIREDSMYTVRHGFGYSIFEHGSRGIKQEFTMFVPGEDSIKVYLIKFKNLSGRDRRISLTLYIRPVLGVSENVTSPFIVTDVDEETGVVLIKNTYSEDFAGRTAFIDCSENPRSITCDRMEFIGKERNIGLPEALKAEMLSGRHGAGFDPCAAIQVTIQLNQNEEKEIVFTLGEEASEAELKKTALKYRNIEKVKEALKEVKEYWIKLLGTIKVNTPDPSLNILTNGWLLYQTIACRIRARSAFYQNGGAYGFRDQLQDSMAAVYADPNICKNQIINSAAHQFLEGDVQHWWHPVTDKGIRTKFSDDLLWLPYVLSDYIDVTGGTAILDDTSGFLQDELLKENEDERYNKPEIAQETGTLYEHCIKAIDKSLKFGPHGIPLMGSGDWNDGMNTVGNKGRGESVWLGWFLYSILIKFAPLCRMKGDIEKAESYISTANNIVEAIEKNAWDGSWYRRAYFDDGTPLGSANNMECQIDSLSQSWSAITGAGKPSRMNEAMGALEQYLIRRDEGLIKLLTPPFDRGDLKPGYIKAYVPGVRENGGQYTHGAVWVIMAYAKLGDGDRAWELFNMINPINHTSTAMEYSRYKVEPYVMAADVYTVEPHNGRGGWTWYTGAAGWMYRVCVEHILGLKIRGDKLYIDPCIPKGWNQYTMSYRYKNTLYSISVKNQYGVNTGARCIYCDGTLLRDGFVPLVDDMREHHVDAIME
jgi:Cellobiose phosphorylase